MTRLWEVLNEFSLTHLGVKVGPRLQERTECWMVCHVQVNYVFNEDCERRWEHEGAEVNLGMTIRPGWDSYLVKTPGKKTKCNSEDLPKWNFLLPCISPNFPGAGEIAYKFPAAKEFCHFYASEPNKGLSHWFLGEGRGRQCAVTTIYNPRKIVGVS
jgi:hypothetical protein